VQNDGLIDLADLEQAFRSDTILVSVMAANNEIEYATVGRHWCNLPRAKVFSTHTAAQAIGKIP